MESSAPAAVMVSPSSDERFWSKLRDRVGTILHQRNPKQRCSPSSSPSSSSLPLNGVESQNGKRFREDSLLLIRALDSAEASLSQLTNFLNAAQQGLCDLAKPSLTYLQQTENLRKEDPEDAQPNAKRHCGPNKLLDKDEETECKKHHVASSQDEQEPGDSEEVKHVSAGKSGNLKKAKNLAISMASKTSSLARELKTIKSELWHMQERCALLEEENRRLRDGVEKGVRPEEDDLVRLQLEALLADKSRLANENANLTRENQCLNQLVEYHQLATQDPSSPSSYEQATIHGVCLDFFSSHRCEESESLSSPSTN